MRLLDKSNSTFGPFIDGAAVDPSGNFYATDSNKNKVKIASLSGVTYELQNTSLQFGGVKWYNDHIFYAVEAVENKIYKYDNGFTVFCEHPNGLKGMSNDLVLLNDKIYISGQKYTNTTKIGDGELWMCDSNGKATILDSSLGRTNGIAIDPNREYLYLSEAFNVNFMPTKNRINKYKIIGGLVSTTKELAIDFDAFDNSGNIDVDGMRFDTDGRLYVSRNGASKVSIFKNSLLVATLNTSFLNPVNLEIINKKIYVIGRCDPMFGTGLGCIDVFEVEWDGAIFTALKSTQSPKVVANVGLIIGMVVGIFALLILMVICARKSFLFKKKRRNRDPQTMHPFVPKLDDSYAYNK